MKVSKRVPSGVHKVLNKLEDHGFDVRVKHTNRSTSLTLEHKDQPITARGISFCSPNDNFDRAIGAHVAFQRAMVDLRTWIGRDGVKSILG